MEGYRFSNLLFPSCIVKVLQEGNTHKIAPLAIFMISRLGIDRLDSPSHKIL